MAESSILFSSKPADKLNERVENEVAEHLFIFFRYCPDYYMRPSNDGRYSIAVENLYSIFVDTGWVINYFWKIFCGDDNYKNYENSDFSKAVNTQSLKDIKDIISCLRTLESHTTSGLDLNITNKAEKWFSDCLNIRKPKSSNHYAVLLNRLNQYADDITQQCTLFLDYLRDNVSEKGDIIHRWESEIIKRYSKKRDIFDNALDVYYFSLDPEKNENLSTSSRHKEKRDQIIISYYFYDIEQLEERYLESDDKLVLDRIETLKKKRLELINRVIVSKIPITDIYELKHLDFKKIKLLKDLFYHEYFTDLVYKHMSNSEGEKSLQIDDIIVNMLENETEKYSFMKGDEEPVARFFIPDH